MSNVEQVILRNVLTNESYMRKVLPFIKPEYFQGVYNQLFKEAGKFVAKYNKLPNLDAFKIEIDNSDKFNDDQYLAAMEILPNIFVKETADEQWLEDTTEKWCQDRAIHNAIMESISIIDGKHKNLTKNALSLHFHTPTTLTGALLLRGVRGPPEADQVHRQRLRAVLQRQAQAALLPLQQPSGGAMHVTLKNRQKRKLRNSQRPCALSTCASTLPWPSSTT